METIYNTYKELNNNSDIKFTDNYFVRFRLDELLPVINLLELLNIDSKRLRDLYYYHHNILGELPSHYLEFHFIPKFKKLEFNKQDIIDDIGQLPIFEVEDIF